jgi:hypothetical protein
MLTIRITKSGEWGLENIFCVIRLNEPALDAGIMTARALVSQFRILLGVWTSVVGFLHLFIIETPLWAVDPYKIYLKCLTDPLIRGLWAFIWNNISGSTKKWRREENGRNTKGENGKNRRERRKGERRRIATKRNNGRRKNKNKKIGEHGREKHRK